MNTMMDFALYYAKLGMPVFPVHTNRNGTCSCGNPKCRNVAKHPISELVPNGFKNATTDEATIRAQWTKYPDANIGYAVPDEIIVVDVDINHSEGKHGDRTLTRLESMYGELPKTKTSSTGGGGRQYFFKTDRPLPSRTDIFATEDANGQKQRSNIDSRGQGGYVILPPSLHRSGRRYAWMKSDTSTSTSIATVPYWVSEELQSRNRKNQVLRSASGYASPPPIYEGSRNDSLFRYAARLHSKGWTERDTLAELLETNRLQCKPPLDEPEVRRIVQSAILYPRNVVVQQSVMDKLKHLSPELNARYTMSDMGGSYLFADIFKDVARYIPERKKWAFFNGKCWELDVEGMRVAALCKILADALAAYALTIKDRDLQAKYVKYADKWNVWKQRVTIVKDAMSVHPVSMKMFDVDPYTFNCLNGTLNLKTGELRAHNPDDMLMKLSSVHHDPSAVCKRWERFIDEVMSSDVERAKFLKKALGYALTGATNYEIFFILYGPTSRNGKGTLMETILRLLGDYGKTAKPETIAQKHFGNGGGPSEDIARLAGARCVNISEPDQKLNLSTALIKSLTGNDTITARVLHENSFEYKPQFKLFINTNHLPKVTDITLFLSGRVMLIPFERHFQDDERDTGLKTELVRTQNLSGILNWCIEGLRMLEKEGFQIPDSVKAATDEYRSKSDKISMFLADEMEQNENAEVKTSDAYRCYTAWCSKNGFHPENTANFKSLLRSAVTIKDKRPKNANRTAAVSPHILGYRLKSSNTASTPAEEPTVMTPEEQAAFFDDTFS